MVTSITGLSISAISTNGKVKSGGPPPAPPLPFPIPCPRCPSHGLPSLHSGHGSLNFSSPPQKWGILAAPSGPRGGLRAGSARPRDGLGYLLCCGPHGPGVTLSRPQLPPAPSPPQLADSSDDMAPGSVPNRWYLLSHLPESWPRARGLHRPHFCFRQRGGRGHAHCGLCGDRAGPAPGEAVRDLLQVRPGLDPRHREPQPPSFSFTPSGPGLLPLSNLLIRNQSHSLNATGDHDNLIKERPFPEVPGQIVPSPVAMAWGRAGSVGRGTV